MLASLLLPIAGGSVTRARWRVKRLHAVGWASLGSAAVLAVCSAVAWLSLEPARPRTQRSPAPLPDTPSESPDAEYVGSATCQPCHEAEYRSWSETYHSSMTRVPSQRTLLAPWTSRELDLGGESYQLEATQEGYFVTLPDPDLRARALRSGKGLPTHLPRTRREVVLLTGSHHYEAYWVRGRRGNELWQVPFVYHFESQRFLPRHSVFLQPPKDSPAAPRWNSNCIQCHSVAGQPRHDLASDQFRTSVAEHGIACEACHGAGAAHVSFRTKHPEDGSAEGDPIVDLRDLGATHASDVCGQCHAYFVPADEEQWWQDGYTRSYAPGGTLDESRQLLSLGMAEEELPELSTTLASIFHSDGTMRVGGRELNAMRASACYERAHGGQQLGCLSCHQLHGGTRADQLSDRGEQNTQCTQCHEASRFDSRAHTHHTEGSQGSRCVNCHMPMTSYALLKGIRSHRITRFSAIDGGVNACILCHQTETPHFGSELLGNWTDSLAFGDRDSKPPSKSSSPPGESAASTAALAAALLAGDAAARALAAFHLGRNPNQPEQLHLATDWRTLLLTQALLDPYAAVRYIAARALRRNPQLENLPFDFVAPLDLRRTQAQALRERAEALAPPPSSLARAKSTLRLASGQLDMRAVNALVKVRDETPVRIAE